MSNDGNGSGFSAGAVLARLQTLERDTLDFCEWRDEHVDQQRLADVTLERRLAEARAEALANVTTAERVMRDKFASAEASMSARVGRLELKVAWFAGAGAAIGFLGSKLLELGLDHFVK